MGEEVVVEEVIMYDAEGNVIYRGSAEGLLTSDMEIELIEEKSDMDKRISNLVLLKDKVEAIESISSDLRYLLDDAIDSALDGDELQKSLDLATTLKLNRIDDELESCFDVISN